MNDIKTLTILGKQIKTAYLNGKLWYQNIPSVNDYNKDGLIMMFDSEYNESWTEGDITITMHNLVSPELNEIWKGRDRYNG